MSTYQGGKHGGMDIDISQGGPADEDGKANGDATTLTIVINQRLSIGEVAQLDVFLRAYSVFLDRNRRHKDTWQDSGWRGTLFDIRKKVDRLWNEFMLSAPGDEPEDYDSALDAINFLGFFVRARQSNIEGVWRWR